MQYNCITVYSTVHITQQVCSGAGHGDSVTYFSRKGINYSLVFWFSSTAKHPATSVRRQTLGLHPWTTTFRKHLGTGDCNLDIQSYDTTVSQSTVRLYEPPTLTMLTAPVDITVWWLFVHWKGCTVKNLYIRVQSQHTTYIHIILFIEQGQTWDTRHLV